MDQNVKKWGPVVAAVVIALAVLIWYVASGRSSLDQNARQLINNHEEVESINVNDPQRVTITCKNGEKYEILFTEGQDNYDDLIFNACGAEGVEEL